MQHQKRLEIDPLHPRNNAHATRIATNGGQSNVRVVGGDTGVWTGGQINVNPIDRFGGTPLEDAYRHGNTAAVELLESRGGLRQDDPSQSRAMHAQLQHIQHMQRTQRRPKVLPLLPYPRPIPTSLRPYPTSAVLLPRPYATSAILLPPRRRHGANASLRSYAYYPTPLPACALATACALTRGRGQVERAAEESLEAQAVRGLADALVPSVIKVPSPPYPLHPNSLTPSCPLSSRSPLHPIPYTLHPIAYTLSPTPYLLSPTPYALDTKPYTLRPRHYALHPKP
eukprot:3941612-Rhodomonas_salina.1